MVDIFSTVILDFFGGGGFLSGALPVEAQTELIVAISVGETSLELSSRASPDAQIIFPFWKWARLSAPPRPMRRVILLKCSAPRSRELKMSAFMPLTLWAKNADVKLFPGPDRFYPNFFNQHYFAPCPFFKSGGCF